MKADDKLTLIIRLKICWNVLTTKEKHNHGTQVKRLSIFELGYSYGFKDAMPRLRSNDPLDFDIKS